MSGNPLVASAVDTATPLSGTGLLDDGAQLVHAIESGDWLAGGLSAFAVGVDTVAAVSDPLGSLIASGLGWLIDHLEPIKGWFDDLTGDAGQVEAFAATWTNIQTQLQTSSQELTRKVADLDSLAGQAIDAYRRFQADAAKHLDGAASWAGAMSTGLRVASQVVQLVHDLVRDVLSQLVGSAISWAAEAVFSLGLATPWIIEQVSTRVASWVAKVGGKLTELLTACKKLAGLLGELHALISKAGALFENALRKTKDAAIQVRYEATETVAGLPGARRLDPRRNELIRNMERWSDDAGIPGYRPFGDLTGQQFVDEHLERFTPGGFPSWQWPANLGFDEAATPIPASTVFHPGDMIDRLSQHTRTETTVSSPHRWEPRFHRKAFPRTG